jgi:hypothetical protein
MRFDLDSATRRRLGYHLIDQIDSFFTSLPDRPVQLPAEQRTFAALNNLLPENGEDADKVLDEIFREMVDKGFHVPSGNYFGLMNPTPTYIGVMAETLVAALNPQLATVKRSQLASKIEHETVRWIGERVGWPGEFNGTFTSGGNEANFTGLALALAAKFPNAIEEGIASVGALPVLYASDEAHHSIDKSAGLLGVGRKALRRIPVNENVQLDLRILEQTIDADLASGKKPFCVVATAGTTNTGAVDDLVALAEICRRYDLWLHVDGAYGGSAVFLRSTPESAARHRASRFDHDRSPQMAGDAAGCRRNPDLPSRNAGARFCRRSAVHAEISRVQGTRQFPHQHPVDAAHELAQTLAHAASPWKEGLRGTHRSPARFSTKLRLMDKGVGAFRIGCTSNSAHCCVPV